jgi:hypothetical protein
VILRRNVEDRFSVVTREWDGATVVILGGGPSLSPEQFNVVRAARAADAIRVIAINDSYLAAPWSDVCYAADAKWYMWMGRGISKPKLGFTADEVRARWASFLGQKCGIHCADPYLPDDAHMLRNSHLTDALSLDPGALSTGRQNGYHGHGGFQALNLATLSGANTIILLGFDGGPSAQGLTHFHGEHPIPTPADVWPYIQRSFSCVENQLNAMSVHVINCSMESAIGSFEKMPLADALMVPA